MNIQDKLLEIQNLCIDYHLLQNPLKAVEDVSLDIQKNEIVGLVGESGCGKSTLGLSILRLLRPPGTIVSGKILLKGENLLKLSPKEMQNIRGERISIVFQDPLTYLNPVMKIKNQIIESILNHQKISKNEASIQTINLLKTMQIAAPNDVANSYPHQLSGGMLQRSLLSMALSSSPELLIADEPTTALDVTIQAQILDLLMNLKSTRGMSILLISHDLGIVSEICDRVYIMYAGKIVEETSVFNLFEQPLHPYTRGLLSAVLSIDEFKERLITIEGNVPNLQDPPSGCRFHPRCKEKMDICENIEPEMYTFENKHKTACWLYR